MVVTEVLGKVVRPQRKWLAVAQVARRLLWPEVAIDLGTSNTLISIVGNGVVLNEPSAVAVSAVTGKIVAVGHDAKRLIGRTPRNVRAFYPLSDGVIADLDATQGMLTHFIGKALGGKSVLKPRVAIAVPSQATEVELRAVEDAIWRVGARSVLLVEEPLAAALGAHLPVDKPHGQMIIDVGAGTTDIAVISLSGFIYSHTLRVAGNEMDEAIIAEVKRTHGLIIGPQMAERIKIQLGCAVPPTERSIMEVKGRDLVSGLPRVIELSNAEVYEAIQPLVAQIAGATRKALEILPPEIAADLIDTGITLVGGGSQLRGFSQLLQQTTELPVTLGEDPLLAVVLGVERMLETGGGFVAGSKELQPRLTKRLKWIFSGIR